MNYDLPGPRELEISLFGPGYGESVVVHLGFGQWMVVDSCLDQRTKVHPVLRYFSRLGLETETSVSAVVVSHWHADHVRGIAGLVQACPMARVCISGAIGSDEVLQLIGRRGADGLSAHNPYREMARLIDVLETRSQGRPALPVVRPVSAGYMVWDREVAGTACRVRALSPSDPVGIAALANAFKDLGGEGTAGWRVPGRPADNLGSVALWVQLGDLVALLGSDLEVRASESSGWAAVLSEPDLPDRKALVFKVPHHGSANGHSSDVWNRMLEPDPVCVLTPFRRLKEPLPTPSDIARLGSLSTRAFSTARRRIPSRRRGPQAIEAAVRIGAVRLIDTEGAVGHVRVRVRHTEPEPNVSIDLEEPARPLSGC